MSDEINRQNGFWFSRLAGRSGESVTRIKLYGNSIEAYLKIESKTIEDFIALAEVSRELAVVYFNLGRYKRAGDCYFQSTQYLQQVVLDDNGYRKLAGLYIDLADACFHLHNQASANDAVGNAIKAFNLIQIKNEEELAIGDPTANFRQLYQYFEKKSSSDDYRASTAFQNHQQLQIKHWEEQSLTHLLGDLSFAEPSHDMASDVATMMQGLALLNPSFVPINVHNPATDVDFRFLAIEFLRLTQSHIQQGDLAATISTYREAKVALERIRNPTEHDQKAITSIETQIHHLEGLPPIEIDLSTGATSAETSSIIAQNQNFYGQLAATIGMFSHVVQPAAGVPAAAAALPPAPWMPR